MFITQSLLSLPRRQLSWTEIRVGFFLIVNVTFCPLVLLCLRLRSHVSSLNLHHMTSCRLRQRYWVSLPSFTFVGWMTSKKKALMLFQLISSRFRDRNICACTPRARRRPRRVVDVFHSSFMALVRIGDASLSEFCSGIGAIAYSLPCLGTIDL